MTAVFWRNGGVYEKRYMFYYNNNRYQRMGFWRLINKCLRGGTDIGFQYKQCRKWTAERQEHIGRERR